MKKFKKVYIEITNVCNLSCDFCPHTCRPQEFMSIDTFNKILNQIKPYTDYIYFHVKGEPLLHPKLSKFLDLSYKKGFKVNITTNGTLISKTRDKVLLSPSLRQINFSLQSFDGNKGATNKDEYINNIISFIKDSINKTDTLFSLRLWNLDKDNNTNLSAKKNYDLLSIIENAFDLSYKIEEKIIPGKGIRICNKVYLNQDYEFEWPDLLANHNNNPGFCYGLRNQVAILVDGTVIPCCLDGEGIINLGNIHKSNFSEILKNQRAIDIFNGFSRREVVEELCRKCGYRKRFNSI